MMAGDIRERCCGEIATAIPIFKRARTEYHDGRSFDSEESKKLPFHCKQYFLEVN